MTHRRDSSASNCPISLVIVCATGASFLLFPGTTYRVSIDAVMRWTNSAVNNVSSVALAGTGGLCAARFFVVRAGPDLNRHLPSALFVRDWTLIFRWYLNMEWAHARSVDVNLPPESVLISPDGGAFRHHMGAMWRRILPGGKVIGTPPRHLIASAVKQAASGGG